MTEMAKVGKIDTTMNMFSVIAWGHSSSPSCELDCLEHFRPYFAYLAETALPSTDIYDGQRTQHLALVRLQQEPNSSHSSYRSEPPDIKGTVS